MRRTSLVAPLLLIGIGVLFLVRNLYHVPFMEYVARYWPWVLIAWGGLRLVEVITWKIQNRPLPAHGVSGGEWLLVVFICLLGAGLHAAQGFANGWPSQIRADGMDLFGEPFDYPVNVEKACTAMPHILLENFRGDVRLTGSDESSVKISGRRSVRTLQREEADRANASAALEITGEADNLVIRPRQESGFEAPRLTYNLDISVPKGAQVEVHGQGGDLNLENVAGATLISERGEVRLRNITGPSQVTVRRGDVHLEAGRVDGQLQVSSGDVNADTVAGPLKISARSGDITVNRASGSIDINVTRGDLNLRPGNLTGPLHAHARSGDISLALPSTAQFSLDASTGNGDVSSDFQGITADTTGRRGSLHGAVGKGPAGKGPTIELRTDRGDLAVHKASANDASVLSGKPLDKPANTPLEKIEQ